MSRLSLALFILLMACVCAAAQTAHDDRVWQSQAIAALTRLDRKVIVYRSLGEFETGGRLAHVSRVDFEHELHEVKTELIPMLEQLPPGRLKSALQNALDSYMDGSFWWRQIDRPRIDNIAELTADDLTRTSADFAFLSTIPYTVAIHWRQAHHYLLQAEKSLGR